MLLQSNVEVLQAVRYYYCPLLALVIIHIESHWRKIFVLVLGAERVSKNDQFKVWILYCRAFACSAGTIAQGKDFLGARNVTADPTI